MRTGARKLAFGLIAAVLLLLVSGRAAAEFLVELWWYRALDHEAVFWTRWNAALLVRGLAALVVALFVAANLWIVARTLGTIRVRRRYANIEIAEQVPQRYIVGTVLIAALFSAWWISSGVGDAVGALAALRAAPWGAADPVFGRDLAFYVFRYPLIDRVQTLAGVLVFWTLLLVAVAYVAAGGLRWVESGIYLSEQARRHLGALLAGAFLVFAWDVWLDRYEVLLPGALGDPVGYTDVHARIPAHTLVALLGVAAAASIAYAAWHARARPAVIGVGALLVGALLALVIYPTLVQRFRVEPDQFVREERLLALAQRATLSAYGLADLEREALPWRAGAPLDSVRLAATLEGAPLWDRRPLLQSWAPQALFRYYTFASAHYDRYGPPGQEQQVAIGVRELEIDSLPAASHTWQNLHLNYVRGEGAVVSPVGGMTPGGEPEYLVRDLPPRRIGDAPEGLALTEPGVYFGERSRGYIVLPPATAAASRADSAAARVRGVALDTRWKKLVYAWAFQSKNLLLSPEVTAGSRVVYRRQIHHRAASLAPWLTIPTIDERSALPVVSDGRIVWMIDGYTTSAMFPLAAPQLLGTEPVRYARASVKATIDAVTGETRLYAVDPADPVLRTWAALFPSLVQPLSEMPDELRRHLRFPAPLLALQAEVLQEFHVRTPRAFYAKEDVWALPAEVQGGRSVPFEPMYAMLPLPGGTTPEFLVSLPFVAAGRQNLTALLVARSDPPHYGEQILYELPRDELINGPAQVESMIDQDPEISEQLSLWKRGGSDVIRGHLITVPLDSALVYVQPVYLVAQTTAIPQLERVILVSGRRVVMRPTLEAAIAALVGSGTQDDSSPRRAAALPTTATPAPAAPTAPDPRLARARRLLERADAQLRAGDLAAFGRTWEELRAVLEAAEPDARTP
jgi:uncharacterized membrane protein (UPF0182 family)